MNRETELLVRDLLDALDASKTSATGRVTVSRTLLWQAKQAIEQQAHRIALLETEAAMQKGQANG